MKKFLATALALVFATGMAFAAHAQEAEETVIEEAEAVEAELSEASEVSEEDAVAKVGNTLYATIDEAVAAWTNGTTLTLMDDVQLSDVITMKSTEHHILNLGEYTMTAASGKHAIEITCDGRSNASYALTINADANNPGGIVAGGKSCIYYKKSGSAKDRPIILINNGVFTGSYSLNLTSNGNTNCPQIWINGGIFNSYINLTKCMLKISGGVFHGSINCTGDSSAYRQISGGRFKSWQFMTADAATKFWVGTAKETYDVGVYVDDEGYLVVGGSVIKGNDDRFEACISDYSRWSGYLKYSSAAEHGLYYTDLNMAYSKVKTLTIVGAVNKPITVSGNTVFTVAPTNAEYSGVVTLENGTFTVSGNFTGSVVSDDERYFAKPTVTEDGTVYSLELITESTKKIEIDETADNINVNTEVYYEDEDGNIIGGKVTVSLPADAFDNSDADEIYLYVKATTPDEASEKFVGRNATVYELEFVDEDGEEVEFEGTVTVRIPYSGTDAASRRVYFINEDGTFEDMNAEYDGNAFVFETTHFSQYAIVDPTLLASGITDKVSIMFKATSNPNVYDIYAVADAGKQINRFSSTQLKFKLVNDESNRTDVAYTIEPAASIKMSQPDEDGYVLFNFDGVTNDDSNVASEVLFAKVTFEGYGKFEFTTVDTAGKAMLHTAEITDNIVDDYTVAGNAEGKYLLVLSRAGISPEYNAETNDSTFGDTITSELYVPTKNLTVNIDFPNAIENKSSDYQQMKLTISGGDLEEPLVIALGEDFVVPSLAVYKGRKAPVVTPDFIDGAYVVEINGLLTQNTAYTVEVYGVGYRTSRYTVNTQEENKTLNFWNNVKDNETAIEAGKKTAKTTFLAGDIVKDNKINVYDLSAVVSYFGENGLVGTNNAYAKYDLNRDGKIDSKDVAYVLVSWGN